MIPTTLHCYQCKNCRMGLIAGMRALPGQPYKCKLCGSYLVRAFEQAVESDFDRQLADEVHAKGQVWTGPVPVVEPEVCALCNQPLLGDPEVVEHLGPVCQRQACQVKLHGDHGRMRLRCVCGRTLAVWMETMAEFAQRGTAVMVEHVKEHVDERRSPAAIKVDCTTCGAERLLATDSVGDDELEKVLEDLEWVQQHFLTCRTTGILVKDASPTVH